MSPIISTHSFNNEEQTMKLNPAETRQSMVECDRTDFAQMYSAEREKDRLIYWGEPERSVAQDLRGNIEAVVSKPWLSLETLVIY